MKKGGGKKGGRPTALGRAIVRDKDRKRRAAPATHDKINFYPTDLEETQRKSQQNKLNSLTQTNDLGDFLLQADLAEKEFFAEKQNVVILTSQSYSVRSEPTPKQLEQQLKHANDLRIPRRPPWDTKMTPLELDHNEKQAFLEWRKSLAELEQNEELVLTPFEKNIEVWRQLWRVVERSDVIVQIVDARNPMVMCTDLDKYIKEVDPNKKSLLLVNKADLLTERQRLMWTRYFHSQGLRFLFWSANYERMRQEASEELKQLQEADDFEAYDSKPATKQRWQQRQQAEAREETEHEEAEEREQEEEGDAPGEEGPASGDEEEAEENPDEDSDQEEVEGEHEDFNQPINRDGTEEDTKDDEESQEQEEEEETENTISEADSVTVESESKEPQDNLSNEDMERLSKIYGVDELLNFIIEYCPPKQKGGGVVVGMVGYPNVGKSSTINVLCGEKKVNVSMTPGKTKHLQTIKLSDQIMLCDCPGLVFPSFLTTKAEMICSGLLPIDHMRDPRPPTSLVCQRLPRSILESLYGIMLPKPGEDEDPNRAPTASELLKAYGRIRGFMTLHGSPDESRAARIILKDYVAGKLLFCHPPPGMEDEWQQWWQEDNARDKYRSFGWEVKETLRLPDEEESEIVQQRRQRQIQQKAKHVPLQEYQDSVVAHAAGRRKGKANFTRVQNTYHSVVPVRRIAQAQALMIQQRKKAAANQPSNHPQ